MAYPTPPSIQKSVDETHVEYVQLGSSGLRVSVPILGTMFLGRESWFPCTVGEEETLDILKACYDRGITTWDTANMYSNGITERLIGKALKKFGIPRQKVIIMTKVSEHVSEDDPDVLTFALPHIMRETKDHVNQAGTFLFCAPMP
jgi:aryl-alcohol dehydrogenase-like predicted oxidoreductase